MSKRWPTAIGSLLSLSWVGMSLLISPPSCADTLQAIQQRGRLIVGVKDNLPPLGFRGADGQLQGLEIEIAQRLAQDLFGHTEGVEFKSLLNQDRLSALLEGQVDLVIAQVSATPARSRLVRFSTPYYVDGTALVTKEPTLKQSTDLTAQKIAVLTGSSTIATLRYRLPKATLVPVESYQAALNLLEAGGAIAFAADASVLAGWVQELPEYHLLTPTLSVDALCVVLPKGVQYDDLRRRINEILARWEAEDWLAERAVYWGLP